MSHSRYSLRGHLEEGVKMAEKMIATDQYSAAYISFAQDCDCPTKPDEANNWVKDQIRLYMETWVLPELRAALEKARK